MVSRQAQSAFLNQPVGGCFHNRRASTSTWTPGPPNLAGMAFTYILRCADDSYYVGSTVHLEARLFQHQQGLGAEYTKRRRPVELVWAAEFETIPEAFAMEKKVQGWGRRKREALIAGRFGDLPGLSSRAWRFRGV